jgi:NitT/TauT family transport system substrate-binding protein
MRSNLFFSMRPRIPTGIAIAVLAGVWLVIISGLHFRLNSETRPANYVRMGYMPVIANLACPLLDYASRDGNGIRFEALKFSSFAEMGEALRNGQIQAAFLIAPLSIVLRQQGTPVRVVYIGNRHESTLVVRNDLRITHFRDLAGKKIAVPMRFSGHNLALRRTAGDFQVRQEDLDIVEMNPPDMPSALATGALDAYFVGEPFAAQAVLSRKGKVLYRVEEIWPGFICNLLLVTQSYIDQNEERVRMLVQGAARSGIWASRNPREAASIASLYWNQPAELIEFALMTPKNRVVFDRFIPKQEEIQFLEKQMVRFNLLRDAGSSGLVEDRFARSADLNGISEIKKIIPSKG